MSRGKFGDREIAVLGLLRGGPSGATSLEHRLGVSSMTTTLRRLEEKGCVSWSGSGGVGEWTLTPLGGRVVAVHLEVQRFMEEK